jgi:hypothetical protein
MSSSITRDIFCLSCKYNLRGLPEEGQCPECGVSIRDAVRAVDAGVVPFGCG